MICGWCGSCCCKRHQGREETLLTGYVPALAWTEPHHYRADFSLYGRRRPLRMKRIVVTVIVIVRGGTHRLGHRQRQMHDGGRRRTILAAFTTTTAAVASVA
jgi:hypothetical protein